MRLVSFAPDHSSSAVGVVADEGTARVVVDLSTPMAELGASRMEELVALDGPVWPKIRDLVEGGSPDHLPRHPIESVTILPPVLRPFQMLFVRANYPGPDGVKPDLDRPAFFSKLPSAMIGEDADILLPALSSQPDWEGELAFVIGRLARHVSKEDAMGYVAGYTITNDITARDIQASGEPTLAKNFRTFAPLGPWLVTPDEVGDPHDLTIKQWVNGTLFQDGSTQDMLFDIPEIIAFLSSVTDLHPGDVIATGAPAGIGKHQEPQVFLADGDTLRVEIEGIGALNNGVRTAPV
jgi:2-keto-4-pentenoate hydratase/2-oxohepta-3-ene-1,7-dioic acid hydratase in catechol pathway